MLDQVKGLEDCGSALRRDNSSNRPSGPGTTASPSIVKLLALISSAAAVIATNRTVHHSVGAVNPHVGPSRRTIIP
jgi:hypothetical protein